MTHPWRSIKQLESSKRVKSAEKSYVPISFQDYALYENALPTPRVLNDH